MRCALRDGILQTRRAGGRENNPPAGIDFSDDQA
jgi:hypothetical protein